MGKFLRVTSWRKAMSMMSSLALLVGLITTSSVTAHAAPAADITATAVVGTTIHQATRKTPRLDRATHLTTFTSIPEVQRYTPHISVASRSTPRKSPVLCLHQVLLMWCDEMPSWWLRNFPSSTGGRI